MKFVTNISKNNYNEFLLSHDKNHFLQSYEWGEFCSVSKKQNPHYVGIEDSEGNLIACSLLLKKSLYLGYSYMYAPRGVIADYKNTELVTFFTNELKKYMKEQKVIFLTIDPDIKYHDVNTNAKKIEDGINNYDIFNSLIDLGYKHKGFNLLYEGNQPRFTFRINLDDNFDNIKNKFSKSFLKNCDKATKYGVKTRIGSEEDLEVFYNLISKTAEKDDFTPYSFDYYKNFYKTFKDNAKIYIAYVDKEEVINNLENKINKTENEKTKEKLNDLITTINEEKEETINIGAHITVRNGSKIWALYAGNDPKYRELNANILLYLYKIKDAYDNSAKMFDLFGVCGDPSTKYKNLAGIFEFKRNFGGECLEFIGEFDLVNNYFLYKLLPFLLKIYRKIKR